MQSDCLKRKGILKQSQTEIPLITVITVVYNGEATLEETILSVINQTYKNIEYIIIDGDSKDNTLEIIKKYENRIDCWISEPDDGIYHAMNKGIDLATGEWINFMNSGDIFYDNDVCNQLVMSNVFQKKGTIIYGDRFFKEDNVLIREKACLKTIRYRMGIFHQSCFVYAPLHKICHFNISYKIAADYDFIYKQINSGKQFIKVNNIICIFLGGGFSTNIGIQLREVLTVIHSNNSFMFRLFYTILCMSRRYYLIFFLKERFPALYVFLRLLYRKIKHKSSYTPPA
jgi:glycosyltransferase involved in cell wall biosynthesis